MFSDKNKIDETSGLSFIVICDNKNNSLLFDNKISCQTLDIENIFPLYHFY